MNNFKDHILSPCQKREGYEIEFKATKGGLPGVPAPVHEVEIPDKVVTEIPAEGGTYFFEINEIRTKLMVEHVFQNF